MSSATLGEGDVPNCNAACVSVLECTAAQCKIILCRSLVSAESHRERNRSCQRVSHRRRAPSEWKHENKNGGIMTHKRSKFSPFGISRGDNK